MEATASPSTAPMKFKIESAGPCRKTVEVTIPAERVTEEFDKSYRQWSRTVPIPGFRPGRAPRKLVEKRFGAQVKEEVKQSLFEAAFDQALKDHSLSPIADPEFHANELEAISGEEMKFHFHLLVKPEFDLPDFQGVEVAVPSADVQDDEVERALTGIRKRRAVLRPVEDGEIQEGDVVSLRVRGVSDGEELFQQEGLLYEIGSHYLAGLVANGLEDLVGKKAGATVEGTAFAPPHEEDHPLAGREATLEGEVLEVKRPDLPELDDELAKTMDYDTAEELKEAVRKGVAREKERRRERLIEDLALAQLVERAQFELPEELIARELDELSRRAAYEMQLEQKSEEEIAQRVQEIRARRREESERELKAFFVLDKIVEKERILVTETEVAEAIAALAAYNGKTPEQMHALLRESGRLGGLRAQLRERKARDRLRAKVKVKDAPAEAPKKAAAKPAATKAKTATKKKKKDS